MRILRRAIRCTVTVFLLVPPQRVGRADAGHDNPESGLDSPVRRRGWVLAPVIEVKGCEFNLLSPTGFMCLRSPSRPGTACVSSVHGIPQRLTRLADRSCRRHGRHTCARQRVACSAGRMAPSTERHDTRGRAPLRRSPGPRRASRTLRRSRPWRRICSFPSGPSNAVPVQLVHPCGPVLPSLSTV